MRRSNFHVSFVTGVGHSLAQERRIHQRITGLKPHGFRRTPICVCETCHEISDLPH
jgi:hypothetical protein